MRFILSYIIFLLGFNTISYAKDLESLTMEYPFIQYTTQNGLPSNETFCVFQDSRGYLWIGTDRGLVKYDGYDFKTYTTLDGLTDNVILSINEDEKGNIWYTGLNNFQLGYIDLEMNFHEYNHYNSLFDSIISLGKDKFNMDQINDIHFNSISFKNDNIYLINRRLGYVVINFDGIVKVQLNYNTENANTYCVINDSLSFIYADKIKSSLVNLKNKVYVNNNYIGAYIKENGNYTFPTLIKQDSVLYIYDEKNYLQINNDTLILNKLDKLCSSFQLSNKFIFSTYDKYNANCNIFLSESPIFNKNTCKLIFEGGRATSIFEDENHGVWITTLKNGLVYFPGFYSKHKPLNTPLEHLFNLGNTIAFGNSANRYLYNKISGELVFEKKVHEYFDLESNQKKTFFSKIPIQVTINNEKGIRGFSGIQIKSNVEHFFFNARSIFKFSNDSISKLFPSEDFTLEAIYIEDIYCFSEDSCLLATKSGLYSLFNNKLEIIELNTSKKRVRHVNVVPKNNAIIYSIWGEGLYIKLPNRAVKLFSEHSGLNSNMINDIYIDSNETVWIATNKGFNSLSFINNEPILNNILKSSKLLSSPNILQIYYENNIVYLGTDTGFDILNLMKMNEENLSYQPVTINKILVNKFALNNDRSIKDLRYTENNISFHYNYISFNHFGETEYRYRLVGLSDDWIYTKERIATFFQLQPGSYTFELEVENESGKWISCNTVPKFYISKPFWKLWWFILGVILLIVLVTGVFIYYFFNNIKQEKKLVEDKQILSEELNESRQKALSSQLNPHFVFNSLNSIQNFILTRQTQLSSDYLGKFSQLMRFVFENSKKLYIPLSDEIEALRLYLELEQVRHNYSFEFIIDTSGLNTREINMPSLLIQPIIENAIWHGLLHKNDPDRKLNVLFYSKGLHLHIEVKDNGNGRQNNKYKSKKYISKQKSSGIDLTKQRLSLLSHSTDLSTSFKIIDLVHEDGTSKGTLVKVKIPIQLELPKE